MMSFIVLLFSTFCVLLQASVPQSAETCGVLGSKGACGAGSAGPRAGGAMIQTKVRRDGPDQQGISLTTQMSTMEVRVTTLEDISGQGRDDLKKQLKALTDTVASTKASLEDTAARVTSAETHVGTLEGTEETGNQEVRAEIEDLKTKFDSLKQSVGDGSSSSLLQSGAAPASWQEPGVEATDAPVVAAPPAAQATASGASITDRCAALETRVDALEHVSAEGRGNLQDELDVLDKEVEAIRTGGVTSLDHTASRVTSADSQVKSLQNGHEGQTVDMRTELESLGSKLKSLSKHVGEDLSSSMLQTAADPAAVPQTTAQDPTNLPLTSRMASLQKRIEQLEEKSGKGRGDLQTQLSAESDKVDNIKAGGTASLEHTTLRVGSTEKTITALKATVEEDKASLMADVESLKAKEGQMEAKVGI